MAPPAGYPFPAPRHLKVTGAGPAFGFERCEDPGCLVAHDGTASSCGRVACPSCGCGGTNLETLATFEGQSPLALRCSCGYEWARTEQSAALRRPLVVSA